jgi:hypothetical protein
VGSAPDAVEAALAAGIERACAPGEWTAVRALVQELEIRRRGRSSLVSLDTERRRRGGQCVAEAKQPTRFVARSKRA